MGGGTKSRARKYIAVVDMEVGIVVTSVSVSELRHSLLKLTQLAESASSRHQTPESSPSGRTDSWSMRLVL